MAPEHSPLVFSVKRSQPVLVLPAELTPHEIKPLSDIDDQDGLRFQIPFIHFYRSEPSMAGKDPARVIKEALSKALVFYYPFAGRLREGHGRKLMVDCTGEGVLFVEADADVRLDQFGDDALQPPFPCFHELLYDVPGSRGVTDSPLMLIQVTRLKCGGFIFALRMNHTMSDATGIVQFMNAIAEIARGANQPSITPIWRRDLLSARDPPRITCTHQEYEQVHDTNGTINPQNDMEERSFFFGPKEISVLRRFIPSHLGGFTSFEIITACVWRCRTIALQLDPNDDVCMMVIVNGRAKFNPPIPVGYYGNGFVYPAAVTTVKQLCENPFVYAVELVKKAKSEVTEEYMHSVADLMVLKGRPSFRTKGSCIVSDVRHSGFTEVDFGWGKPLYSGQAEGGIALFYGVSFYVPFKNAKREDGTMVPIRLPAEAMERFAKELDTMCGNNY